MRDKLLEAFPELNKEDIRSTSMGAQGEDIQLSPAARKLIPIQFECKARASFSGYAFLEQAGSFGNHTPVVVIKGNNKRPVVLMYAEDFIQYIKGIK